MLSDRDRSFFAPLWRRIAVIAFCAIWAGWEWSQGENTWALMVGAVGAYGVWVFIIRFDEEEAKRLAKINKASKDSEKTDGSDEER